MTVALCEECGTAWGDDNAFCTGCGQRRPPTPAQQAAVPPMPDDANQADAQEESVNVVEPSPETQHEPSANCAACGKTLKPGAAFCTACGAAEGETSSRAEAWQPEDNPAYSGSDPGSPMRIAVVGGAAVLLAGAVYAWNQRSTSPEADGAAVSGGYDPAVEAAIQNGEPPRPKGARRQMRRRRQWTPRCRPTKG